APICMPVIPTSLITTSVEVYASIHSAITSAKNRFDVHSGAAKGRARGVGLGVGAVPTGFEMDERRGAVDRARARGLVQDDPLAGLEAEQREALSADGDDAAVRVAQDDLAAGLPPVLVVSRLDADVDDRRQLAAARDVAAVPVL